MLTMADYLWIGGGMAAAFIVGLLVGSHSVESADRMRQKREIRQSLRDWSGR